jgi:hypothetical protein
VRILLDENLDWRLRRDLPGHTVESVSLIGWAGFKNGTLVAEAEKRFDVLLTMDGSMCINRTSADSSSPSSRSKPRAIVWLTPSVNAESADDLADGESGNVDSCVGVTAGSWTAPVLPPSRRARAQLRRDGGWRFGCARRIGTPAPLRHALTGHSVSTALGLGEAGNPFYE